MTIIELIQLYPEASIILIALVVTLISMLVTRFFTDVKRVNELKEKQKACQAKVKEHKGDQQKMLEYQKEMLECSSEMMRHSFKPMLITLIPLLIIFGIIRSTFSQTSIAGSWIWYYIGTSIISSIIYRKLLKM